MARDKEIVFCTYNLLTKALVPVGDRIRLQLPQDAGRYMEIRPVPGGVEVRLGDPGVNVLAILPDMSNSVRLLSIPRPEKET